VSPNRRDAFDLLIAVYAAELVAPAVGEFAGFLAYIGTLVGVALVVYSGASKSERLPERIARRPYSTAVFVVPLLYGVVYVVGSFASEPPVRSPYVYLGLWNVIVGVAVVAVARRTA
jgi:uncharacterized membrane protein YjfL (UPF0719 family)